MAEFALREEDSIIECLRAGKWAAAGTRADCYADWTGLREAEIPLECLALKIWSDNDGW